MIIQDKLKRLSKPQLVKLVAELHGRHDDIDQTILHYITAASEDDNALFSVIQRQLESIADDTSFIDYHHSDNYSDRLLSLLKDIDTLLRELSPEQALQATESFIRLHESVFERADDSNGEIGYVFHAAVKLWLDIAGEVRLINPDALNWVDKVVELFEQNDYGVLDDIISHSGNLLSEGELAKLAERFEEQAKKALNLTSHNGYNRQASYAIIGLQSVAEAKKDMALFEKSYLLKGQQLNSLQIEKIITFAFDINDLEAAKHWLEQPVWQDDPYRFKSLRNRLLELQGDSKALKAHLAEDFNQNPSEFSLKDYWQVADKAEQNALMQKMPELVETVHSPKDAIAMALIVQHYDLAQELLIKHGHQLTPNFYGTFLHWLGQLNEKTHPLACVVCYRCLLVDLLDRGYSKAYHHGADYFHKLLALDKHIADYQNLANAQSFIRNLQQQHGRKRLFWQQAKYSNKPSVGL
jgi:hypothetical protein|tara:strand:+ start:2612 stop:4015 length:1404 start_codon:yes stop_codon:yes gene_type:complete